MLRFVLFVIVPLGLSAALFSRDLAMMVEPAPAAATTEDPARASPPPTATRCARGEAMKLHADRSGHFTATAEIDGRLVPMVIDTGATRVVLPYEEARRVGLRPDPSRTVPVNTANGVVHASIARANSFRIGPICMTGVDVLILPPGRVSVGLIGMSVIGSLSRFEMSRTRLVMAH